MASGRSARQARVYTTSQAFHSSFPLFFQPHVLFLYYLRGMRGRSSCVGAEYGPDTNQ
jgi:hypothetical protein